MDTIDFFKIWTGIYVFDLIRYLLPASLAFLIFWVIGRDNWRHLFIQRDFPKNIQLWREFGYSMSTVLIFSLIGYGVYQAEKAGLTSIYHDMSTYGIVYLIASLIVAIVFHDCYFYWTHRLMHLKKLFKHVHRVHHQSTNPSPWAAYSFHPWEAIIQAMVVPVLTMILPLHDLTLFIFLAYMIIRNVIGHLGFEILPKGFTRNKWLNWNTAITHHNMHHQHVHSNYGLYFTWWDRIMKTEHKEYHERFDEVKSRASADHIKKPKKRPVVISIALLLMYPHFSSSQSVEGKWMTYNEETGAPLSVIEIAKTGSSIEGKVVEIFLEPNQGDDPVCTKCVDDRKGKKVLGMNFLWGLKRDGNVWAGGKILDPKNGEVYTSKLWLEDENTLVVRGYGGMMNLFYRTQTWKRKGYSTHRTPLGMWSVIDETFNRVKSTVEIIERNGELLGYIRQIFLLPNEGTDPVCTACTGPLKDTKIVGMKILSDFEWTGEKWENGKILDPGNGKVYTSSLWLTSADELRIRGFLGPFYRTQRWKRLVEQGAR